MDQDDNVQNDSYVSDMPGPPRVNLNLTSMSSDGAKSESQLFEMPSRSNVALPNFLMGLNLAHCLYATRTLEMNWSYNLRHAAQSILPFIHLGPLSCVKDSNILRDSGITMIVAVRNASPSQHKPLNPTLTKAQQLDIAMMVLDVPNDRSLMSKFPLVTKSVNDHLDDYNAGRLPMTYDGIAGSILFCCDSGNLRSAALVITYIMETFGIPLFRAFRIVQSRRFCIVVDEPVKQTLLSYETILEARRNVMEARQAESSPTDPSFDNSAPGRPTIPQPKISKRVREVDADVDMEEADDIARFEGRTFAPFQSI